MPGIWCLHCRVDGPGDIQPQQLRGFASTILDGDGGHNDVKPWSVGLVAADGHNVAINVGIVDHRLSDTFARSVQRDDLMLGRRSVRVERITEVDFWDWSEVVNAVEPVQTLKIIHRTPTGRRIRVGPDNVQVTHPLLVFEVLVEGWRHRWIEAVRHGWGPSEECPPLTDLASSIVHLDGRTDSFEVDREPFIGFVGEIHHRIHAGSDESCRWLRRLARLATVTGTGARTSAGAGVTEVDIVMVDAVAPRGAAKTRRGSRPSARRQRPN